MLLVQIRRWGSVSGQFFFLLSAVVAELIGCHLKSALHFIVASDFFVVGLVVGKTSFVFVVAFVVAAMLGLPLLEFMVDVVTLTIKISGKAGASNSSKSESWFHLENLFVVLTKIYLL